jgi:hypothetical protein
MAVWLPDAQSSRMANAAHDLAAIIRQQWPWVDQDPDTDLRIVPEVQGYSGNKAIDLVLMARFGRQAEAPAIKGIQMFGGQPFTGKKVRIETLALVVEVKDHPSPNWRLTGSKVEVRYGNTWHDASAQAYGQVSALRDFYARRNSDCPFIAHCTWLRGAKRSQFGAHVIWADPVWAGDDSWSEMLNCIMSWLRVHTSRNGVGLISSFNASQAPRFGRYADHLTRQITGSPLVLRQIDGIIRREIQPEWTAALGRKQIHLRGRAGTGKTAILLQLARAVATRPDAPARVVLLTFNRALTTNLARMLNLLEPGDPALSGAIRCSTQDKYFQAVFAAAGLGRATGSTAEEFQAAVNERMAKALKWARARRAAGMPLQAVKSEDNWPFEFDYLFVDEAQDVPDNAFALLRELFPPSRTVVADGVDQIVRVETPCSWEAGLDGCESLVVDLTQCLRMKANLARFANEVARHMGLNWHVEPVCEMPGGQVIVSESDYFADPSLHQRLVQANAMAGNSPLDMLMCLPREFIRRDKHNHYLGIIEELQAVFDAWKQPVWDATDEDNRNNIMQQPQDLRLLPYTSCRGLEGWTVILVRPDLFFQRHLDRAIAQAQREAATTGCLEDAQTLEQRAALYMMIPLTRAIDTLVITLGRDTDSLFTRAIRAAAHECSDYVERHERA